MAESLSDAMDFGIIVEVHADGTFERAEDQYPYFELTSVKGDDDQWHDEFSIPEGWELLKGLTGQYGYNGPVMHSSEFIGRGLERYILETPGLYVSLVVETHCGYTEEFCTEESGCNCAPAGWAIAHKPAE